MGAVFTSWPARKNFLDLSSMTARAEYSRTDDHVVSNETPISEGLKRNWRFNWCLAKLCGHICETLQSWGEP